MMTNKSIKNVWPMAIFLSILFMRCSQDQLEIETTSSELEMIEVDESIFSVMETALNSDDPLTETVEPSIESSIGIESSNDLQNICGNIPLPRFLIDLNRNEIYTSNITLQTNSSLSAYGFSGTMGKKDILVIAYLVKFKDYTCGNTTKRAQVGIKLYVHASDVKLKLSSPTLPVIAAAVELGLAKAQYKFETFGINPKDIYQNLPSAQFTVDTYSKVISAYDNIIHSLTDSTKIDPIITSVPKQK